MPRKTKEEASLYLTLIIVAGSRRYDDYVAFCKVVKEYLETKNFDPGSFIFISGMASSGADKMIVDFCKEFGYNWVEYPAAWDDLTVPNAVIRYRPYDNKPYNVLAGMNRNAEMLEACTHLLAFWNGKSPGTRNMIETTEASKKDCVVSPIIF